VGVGVTYPEARGVDLKGCLHKLMEEDDRFAPLFRNAGCIEMHRGFIPGELFPGQRVAHGLLIIGDAAGQASALAGEGIRFAMEMGELAARTAAEALSRGGPRKEGLARAHREWDRRHGRNFRIAMEINRRMASFSDPQWDKAVRYTARLTDKQFLQFLKTDFTLSLFLRIIARNPDLAGKALVRTVLRELRKGPDAAGKLT
jgi:flavin-dependent dehydrogenase